MKNSVRITLTQKDGEKSVSHISGREFITRSIAVICFMPTKAEITNCDALTCVEIEQTKRVHYSGTVEYTNPVAVAYMTNLLNNGYEITEQLDFDTVE